MGNDGIELKEDIFGYMPTKEPVKRFTLTNKNGMKVQLISYGAAVTSLVVPDGNGEFRDVVLGFDDLDGYLGVRERNPYFGATIGRVANRTRKAKFSLNGQNYQLTVNNGENHLHGGEAGFDKRVWNAYVHGTEITFSYLSRDGEEGYPGDVLAQVTFQLTSDNTLLIKYQATSTKPTPICLTNHSHFNLGGHEEANRKLEGHIVQLNASTYTPLDAGLIAIGEIKNVSETLLYDLQTPKDLKALLEKFPPGPNGYDINFCINRNQKLGEPMNFVGRVTHTKSKLAMELRSDQPGVQFYTCNFMPDPMNGEVPMKGKNNAEYFKHGGFALETQNYPNAINLPTFPNAVLNPGEVYVHNTSFKFVKVE